MDHIFPYSIPEYVKYQYKMVWYFRWMPKWLFRASGARLRLASLPDGHPEVMPLVGEPYLSLVVAMRNDDHGGNPLGRMQAFINGWIGQSRRSSHPIRD